MTVWYFPHPPLVRLATPREPSSKLNGRVNLNLSASSGSMFGRSELAQVLYPNLENCSCELGVSMEGVGVAHSGSGLRHRFGRLCNQITYTTRVDASSESCLALVEISPSLRLRIHQLVLQVLKPPPFVLHVLKLHGCRQLVLSKIQSPLRSTGYSSTSRVHRHVLPSRYPTRSSTTNLPRIVNIFFLKSFKIGMTSEPSSTTRNSGR